MTQEPAKLDLGLTQDSSQTQDQSQISLPHELENAQQFSKPHELNAPLATTRSDNKQPKTIDPSQDLVSIVIPSYNTGKYIEPCLESCINQTYPNIEIIVVDDCSTDGQTVEFLKQFAAQDSRIKLVLNKENRGQSYCRNQGADLCQGKYFCFLDSDDTMHLEFIERMYHAIIKFKTEMAICDTCNYTEKNKEFKQVDDSELHFNFSSPNETVVQTPFLASIGFLISFPASCYSKLFNTECYRKAGIRFYEGKYSRHCEDEDWATQTVLGMQNFVVLKFDGVMRRIHEDSVSSPCISYYINGLDAAYRRCMLVKNKPYENLYVRSIAVALLKRALRLNCLTLNYEDRIRNIEIIHEYLGQFNTIHNINPYIFSPSISKEWHQILGAMDSHPLPLVYFSLKPLYNTFLGEANYTKQLLENLASYSIFTTSFNTLFDHHPATLISFQNITKQINSMVKNDSKFLDIAFTPEALLCNHRDDGVTFILAQTQRFTSIDDCPPHSVEVIRQGLLKTLKSYLKDKSQSILMISGGDLITQCMAYVCKSVGYKVVYLIGQNDDLNFVERPISGEQKTLAEQLLDYVINSSLQEAIAEAKEQGLDTTALSNAIEQNKGKYIFDPRNFDAVFALNSYYAKTFNERYGTKSEFLGLPFNPWIAALQEERDKPHNLIAFTEPSVENGLAIVLKIVQRCKKLHPDYKFIFFIGLGNPIMTELPKIHDTDGNDCTYYKNDLVNISFKSDQSFDPIHLAGLSCVTLKPMLSNDISISSIPEALYNDVPIIGTDCEKLRSLVGDAGIYLEIPETTKNDPACLPTDEEIQPWIDALERAVNAPRSNNLDKHKEAYRQTMNNWMHRLYEIVGKPEIHDYPTDERVIDNSEEAKNKKDGIKA